MNPSEEEDESPSIEKLEQEILPSPSKNITLSSNLTKNNTIPEMEYEGKSSCSSDKPEDMEQDLNMFSGYFHDDMKSRQDLKKATLETKKDLSDEENPEGGYLSQQTSLQRRLEENRNLMQEVLNEVNDEIKEEDSKNDFDESTFSFRGGGVLSRNGFGLEENDEKEEEDDNLNIDLDTKDGEFKSRKIKKMKSNEDIFTFRNSSGQGDIGDLASLKGCSPGEARRKELHRERKTPTLSLKSDDEDARVLKKSKSQPQENMPKSPSKKDQAPHSARERRQSSNPIMKKKTGDKEKNFQINISPAPSNNFILTKEERRREYMQRVERFVMAYEGVRVRKKKTKRRKKKGGWQDSEIVQGMMFLLNLFRI